jgi:RNA polymerase sigma-70 factor (ECF subfamily)
MLNEKILIEQCLKGDRVAQRELFDTFKGRFMAVALRYIGNRDGAVDVLQDAFVKIFRQLNTYRGEGVLEAWMRRIVVNTALNAIRKTQQLREDPIEDTFNVNPGFNSALSHLDEKELLALIAALPAGYRTVFNLYVIEGYDHKDIAGMLNISESTSRTQLLKARLVLQKKIIVSSKINYSFLNTAS